MQNCTGVGVLRWQTRPPPLLLLPAAVAVDEAAAEDEHVDEGVAALAAELPLLELAAPLLAECLRSSSPLTSSSPELPLEPALMMKCWGKSSWNKMHDV